MAGEVILLGAGGHAVVVAALGRAAGFVVTGVIDPDEAAALQVAPPPIWTARQDDALLGQGPEGVAVLNGVGANRPASLRRRLFDRFSQAGYAFPALVHPFCWVAPGVTLEDGAQIMAGAVIQPRSVIGRNVIVNTRASVDHDCRIGDHVHIAPGATLCGSVIVDVGAMIGAGAVVAPGIRIGAGAMIGAGAAVVRDVAASETLAGVPARALRRD